MLGEFVAIVPGPFGFGIRRRLVPRGRARQLVVAARLWSVAIELWYIASNIWSIADFAEDWTARRRDRVHVGRVNSSSTKFRVRLVRRQALSGRPAVGLKGPALPARARARSSVPPGKTERTIGALRRPQCLLSSTGYQRPRVLADRGLGVDFRTGTSAPVQARRSPQYPVTPQASN